LAKPSDLIVIATIVAGVGIAAAIDLRTRRVPNLLTAALAALGLAFAASGLSGLSVWMSLAGLVLGLALMLPGHLLGATGAGDVKLFAAIGTLVGPAHIVPAFIFTALAGGVMALAFAASRGRLQRTLGRTATLVASGGSTFAAIKAPVENNRFPYAPAIAVGCVIAALGL
jgi:prepilin peptidase CpaA